MSKESQIYDDSLNIITNYCVNNIVDDIFTDAVYINPYKTYNIFNGKTYYSDNEFKNDCAKQVLYWINCVIFSYLMSQIRYHLTENDMKNYRTDFYMIPLNGYRLFNVNMYSDSTEFILYINWLPEFANTIVMTNTLIDNRNEYSNTRHAYTFYRTKHITNCDDDFYRTMSSVINKENYNKDDDIELSYYFGKNIFRFGSVYSDNRIELYKKLEVGKDD